MRIRDLEKARAYSKKYYYEHLEESRAKTRRKSKRNKEYLDGIKANQPCSDCGNIYPVVCMDYDHINGNKYRGVSTLVSYSIKRIDEEIKKCELVCANCHRIRTHIKNK